MWCAGVIVELSCVKAEVESYLTVRSPIEGTLSTLDIEGKPSWPIGNNIRFWQNLQSR